MGRVTGAEREASAQPGALGRRLAAGSLLLVLVASLFGSVHPWYDPTNDGSMYIATARSLAGGEGYTYLGSPFLIRPPGFSCLIAPLVALRGTDFLALNLYVSLFGVLGVFLFHFHLRERLGLVLAWLVPLVLWFNPGYQRLCNQVMSDVPGWTALVACLLLERKLARRRTLGSEVWLGAAVALSSVVRSGNLLLLPALACARLAARWSRPSPGEEGESWSRLGARLAALLLSAVLVLLPWSLRNQAVAPPPPADQTLLYSYSTGMWHRDMGDPRSPRLPLGEVAARFPLQGAKIVRTLGTRLAEQGTSRVALALLLMLALVASALRQRRAEDFFALGTLLVVSFYFGYAGRLLLPVFALALAALVELVHAGAGRLAGSRRGTALAALLCLAWLTLDWKPCSNWQEIERLHRAYEATARGVSAELGPDERLGAYRGWHHAVFLERPVYSFEHAIERAGDVAAAQEVIGRYDLDAVLLTPLGLPEPVQDEERAFAAHIARHHGGRDLGLVRVR